MTSIKFERRPIAVEAQDVGPVGQPSFYVSATSARENAPQHATWLPSVKSVLGACGPASAYEGIINNTTMFDPNKVINSAAGNANVQKWIAQNPSVDLFANPSNPASNMGPLNDQAYNSAMKPILNVFGGMRPFLGATVRESTEQLEAGGALGIAGRSGINGVKGWSGLAGPNGGFMTKGLTVNGHGDYVNAQGKIVEQVEVAWSATESRPVRLVQKYTAARADQFSKNGKLDSTFMVDSTPMARAGETRTYKINVPANEMLNVSVLAADELSCIGASDFDLEILDVKGNVIANSIEKGVDFIQMYNAKERQLQVRVTLKENARVFSKPTQFRLMVDTGGTELKPSSKTEGAHRMPLGTLAVAQPK